MMKSRESIMSGLMPQEEMLEVAKHKSKLNIGIPKEISHQENRVSLIPEAVALLVINGHHVVVETGAGIPSSFTDQDYSEAGAEIAYTREDVFKSDIILKVEPPTVEEMAMMKAKQTLISALQFTIAPDNFIKELSKKKITAVAFDYLQDDEGLYPVVRSMSEIAGNASVLIAAEYLSNASGGKGLMLGGVPGIVPAEVVIIGAGTVGEFAARSALGLGATVKIFDNSTYKLRRIQENLNTRVFTSVIQPEVLKGALSTADAAIGAIRAKRSQTPCVVTEGMVENMKKGSVIIDVSIDQGGCFETSRVTYHDNPTFVKHDIIHFCVPNITSRVSRTSSRSLSNIFAPILLEMGDMGGIQQLIRTDEGVRNGVYIYNGILTNRFLGEHFNLPYKNIELLMAAF